VPRQTPMLVQDAAGPSSHNAEHQQTTTRLPSHNADSATSSQPPKPLPTTDSSTSMAPTPSMNPTVVPHLDLIQGDLFEGGLGQ